MAIYYYVNLNCPPREQLGEEPLFEGVRAAVMAREIRASFVAKYGPDVKPEQMRYRQRFTTPTGEEESRERTVADLQDDAALLEPLAPHCSGCLASITGHAYGCFGSVSLPISEKAERWLLSRIPKPGTKAGEFYRETAMECYGGHENLANWRKATFLESPKRLARHDMGDGDPVTSDQLLHAMFLVGDIAPAHALALLLFTQAIVADDNSTDKALEVIEQVEATGSNTGVSQLGFSLIPEEDDDRSILDLKLFLAGCFRAFSFEVPLAVWL